MRALRADRSVPTPNVFDSRDGSPVVCQSLPGVPNTRTCMLFGWISGTSLRHAMTVERARLMDELAARLHQHAAFTTGSEPPPVLIADHVLYWRVENRLGELGRFFIDEALQRAEETLAATWSDQADTPHLLHGDLTSDNVIVNGGLVIPIDFQDLVWRHEIQDLAISLVAFGSFEEPDTLRDQFLVPRRGFDLGECGPAAADFGDDFFGCFVPHVGLGVEVPVFGPVVDPVDQVPDAGEGSLA
jgi:Ser/Thr protein kinase RdoA (MazF antagonist)